VGEPPQQVRGVGGVLLDSGRLNDLIETMPPTSGPAPPPQPPPKNGEKK